MLLLCSLIHLEIDNMMFSEMLFALIDNSEVDCEGFLGGANMFKRCKSLNVVCDSCLPCQFIPDKTDESNLMTQARLNTAP